ncbi:hypothetical protein R3Q15_02275 [Gordonia amicalis]|uniref:Uncharacterized protein n=1 Tax=Gordonia amicalis TaxID=89053 RepID=A0AAE4R4G3_9ACTN|nr:hypothetical protein [Gordonia amicalis]MDV6310736.1 hypothetical protein [Gordonia amicalis]
MAKKVVSRSRASYIGVIDFVPGGTPEITWAHAEVPDIENEELLLRAMRCEFRALLEWGRAIWQPSSYHYELPSGDHAGYFVRIADMFRNLRDVEVVATWFYERLESGLVILAESASLIPLIAEIRRVMSASGMDIVGVATFDEYPRTEFEIAQVVQDFDIHSRILAIMSVNSSGRYLDMVSRALDGSVYPTDLVVMVDKTATMADCSIRPIFERENSKKFRWVGMASRSFASPTESGCRLCADNSVAQVVRIDPRSFEALALPGQNLVMPSRKSAIDMSSFFRSCSELDAIAFLEKSNSPARAGSKDPMGIKFELDKLIGNSTFRWLAMERLFGQRKQVLERHGRPGQSAARPDEDHRGVRAGGSTSSGDASLAAVPNSNREARETPERNRSAKAKFLKPRHSVLVGSYDAIVVSRNDSSIEGFDSIIGAVQDILQIDVPVIEVALDAEGVIAPIESMADKISPLILSVGSVSGWTLRQMLVGIEDVWDAETERTGRAISALVVHATSRSVREFENTAQSFSGRLHAIWKMFLPDRWPLVEELDYIGGDGDLGEGARQEFFKRRQQIVSERTKGQCVMLGPSEDVHVRNESLYGLRLNSVASLVAVGAAVHFNRLVAKTTDPRWSSFDFVSISRSYYDGLLVAAMLRWCDPGEIYWGASPADQHRNVEELLTRFTQDLDLRILYPELLLGVMQGKIPRSVTGLLAYTAVTKSLDWDARERAEIVELVRLVGDAGFEIDDALVIAGSQ